MRSDVAIALVISAALHVGAAVAGYAFKSAPPPPEPPTEDTTIEVAIAPPPPEPEEPEIYDYSTGDTAGGSSDVAAPTLADVPTATLTSSFIQPVQPPPPPGVTVSAGAITIPTVSGTGGGTAGVGHGLGKLFDLAELDQGPVLRFQAKPIYPYEMTRSGIEGQVTVSFVVDPNGRVRDAVAVSSTHRAFESAATQAVLKWRFTPGTKNGRPVATRMIIAITFNIQN